MKQLYELQELDWKIAEGERSLAEVRARLADDSPITSARRRAEDLRERLEAVEAAHRAAERSVAEVQESLAKVESKLYGGAVTSERELTAGQEEREFMLGRKSEEEDRLLEAMVEMEELQSAYKEAEETLTLLETRSPAEKEELHRTQDALTVELRDLGSIRAEIVPLLASGDLSRYESLLKSKNGHAVARVERGMCQGCRLALSTMELQRARSARGVVQCSSCRRILYVV